MAGGRGPDSEGWTSGPERAGGPPGQGTPSRSAPTRRTSGGVGWIRVQQRYNSYHDHARLAVHVTVEDLQLYQHVGVGDQVEAAGLAPPW